MKLWKEREVKTPALGPCFALLLVLAGPAAVPPGQAADWPMFRGNEARTGFVPEQASPPLSQDWFFQAGGAVLSSPAVFDGRVYFGARDGKLYALNAADGSLSWSYQAGARIDSSPCVSGGAVYAASADGYLYALDRLSGALLWRAPLGAPSASSPLAYGGRIYAGAGLPEKSMKVFDAATGVLLRSLPAGQPAESAPAAYGGRVYFGANDGVVYAADAVTLQVPAGWQDYDTAGSFGYNAVAAAGGLVYALPGRDDKSLFALDAVTGGETLRSQPVSSGASWQTFTSPVAAGGRIYFAGAIGQTGSAAAGNNYLSAVATDTLVSVWASSPSLGGLSGMGMLSSPALAGEVVYAGTIDGRLLAVSSANAQVDSLPLSGAAYSSPAVANGRVFIGTMDGRLYAFKAARTAAFSSPAPGAVVYGQVSLAGFVDNPALAGYDIAYSTGGAAETWHPVVSSDTAQPVYGAELTAWNAAGLDNGEYTLRLTARETGTPVYSNTALLTLRLNAPPAPPPSLLASDEPGDGGNAVRLNWTASPTAGLSAYRIYRSAGDGFALIGSAAPSAADYLDSAAVTGSTYTYAVRAYDGYSESADSPQASAYSMNNTGDFTPPSPVLDLLAEPGPVPGRITLTWTATGNDGDVGYASYFLIKYSTRPNGDWAGFEDAALSVSTRAAEGPAGDNISAEIGGLYGGVTYYFSLRAADAVPNYSSISNSASSYALPDLVPPGAPSSLAVADTPGDDGGSLTLSWTLSPDDGAGAGDVYGYRIYRRTAGGSFSRYAAAAPGAAAYTDAAAAENVRYYYAVSAFDSTGESALAPEAVGVSVDNWRYFDSALGGSVRLSDGARVDIPAGAASQNDSIMFTRLDPVSYQPLSGIRSAAGARPTGVVYQVRFERSDTRLGSPARISLPYTDAETAGMTVENLRLYTPSNGAWTLVNTSEVNAAARTVSAYVTHFSTYSIMEYVPSGAVLAAAEVYTYPNPATGDTVTFKFRPAYKAHVKIEVYNIAGEKVASFERADCPAGQASEIAWNVRGVASGVYVFRLEAASAAGSKTVTKKFAIAH